MEELITKQEIFDFQKEAEKKQDEKIFRNFF